MSQELVLTEVVTHSPAQDRKAQAKEWVTITCPPAVVIALLALVLRVYGVGTPAAAAIPENPNGKLTEHMIVDHDGRIRALEAQSLRLANMEAMIARIDERTKNK